MPTSKKQSSLITNQRRTWEKTGGCYDCAAPGVCWGTLSGAIKFCVTNGKDPNNDPDALPGNMMMTEEISRGSGIVESFTNTGLRVWTFSDSESPAAKAMKGLLDEYIRQNPWQHM